MKVGVISLGCAKNQVDTERMLGLLGRFGYAFTPDPSEAEVLIVNTCGFIDPIRNGAAAGSWWPRAASRSGIGRSFWKSCRR